MTDPGFLFCPRCATPRVADLPYCGKCAFAFIEHPAASLPADLSATFVDQPANDPGARTANSAVDPSEGVGPAQSAGGEISSSEPSPDTARANSTAKYWWIGLAVTTLIAMGAATRMGPNGDISIEGRSLVLSLLIYLAGFGIALGLARFARSRGSGPRRPVQVLVWGIGLGWVCALLVSVTISVILNQAFGAYDLSGTGPRKQWLSFPKAGYYAVAGSSWRDGLPCPLKLGPNQVSDIPTEISLGALGTHWHITTDAGCSWHITINPVAAESR